MDFESQLAGLCLYGFIKNNSQKEKARCLKAIQISYGYDVEKIVRKYLDK